jgi:hypothetical protein
VVCDGGHRSSGYRDELQSDGPVATHINIIQNWFEELKAKVLAGGAGK